MTQPTPISRVRVRGGAADPDLGPLDPAGAAAEADAVVAVGADAVADQALAEDSAPVLPVGIDDHGTPRDELGAAADALAAGDYRTVSHPVLAVTVDDEQVARGVFDVTLMTSEPARISEYALAAAGKRLFEVRADGVVVSTPLGSAGYGRAAGGPVVAPGAGLSVVPVSPFSTRATPWVVPGPISLSVERDEGEVSLYVDAVAVAQVTPDAPVVVERVGTFTCLRPLTE